MRGRGVRAGLRRPPLRLERGRCRGEGRRGAPGGCASVRLRREDARGARRGAAAGATLPLGARGGAPRREGEDLGRLPPSGPPAAQVRARGLTPGSPPASFHWGLGRPVTYNKELEGVNKISIGLETSSWGNHPPTFEEHFLFALYFHHLYF